MTHLKRSGMPKFWPLARKRVRFASVPVPGAHPKKESLPLNVVVRDIFKLCETNKEAKKIIKNKELVVNSKEITEERLPVGIMDIVTVKQNKKSYLVIPSKKGFDFRELTERQIDEKYSKIIGKRLVKKGLQLNLHDGRNILLKKEDSKKYHIGDTIKTSLKTNKIVEIVPYKVGEDVLIIKGKNRGVKGKLKELIIKKDMYGQRAKVEINKEDKLFMKNLIFVVPKGF